MRIILVFCLFCIVHNAFSQENEFQLEGRIIGLFGKPVADAYLINFRNMDKNTTNSNGVFSISVLPSDSMIVSHISYHRKIVSVYQILLNPIVELEVDSINIAEINISPDQKTDYERARDNIEPIKSIEFPSFTKIKEEPNPVLEMATANNRVLRTEASSVSLVRFSPSEQLNKLFKKFKKKDKTKDFNSTKKQKKQESK